MVRLQRRIDELGLRTMMIVQVHDELIFEVPNDEIDQVRDLVLEIMPTVLELDVPLNVEIKSGASWGNME